MRIAIFSSFGLKVAQAALSLISSIAIARWLGPYQYGEFAFVLSVAALVAVLIQFGQPTLLMRLAATSSDEVSNPVRGAWESAVQASFLIFCVLAILSMLLVIGADGRGAKANIMFFSLLLGLGFAQIRLGEGVLLGLGCSTKAQIPEKLALGVLVLFLVGAAHLYFGESLDFKIVSMLYTVSVMLCAALIVFFVRRAALPSSSAGKRSVLGGYRVLDATPFFAVSIVGVITGQADSLLLGFMVEPKTLGLYKVAYTWAACIVFAMTALDAVFFPKFAALSKQSKKLELQGVAQMSARMSSVFAVLVFLVLILFGRDLTAFLYGDSFDGVYPLLAILAVAQLVNALAGSPHGILNLSGHEKVTLRIATLWALISIPTTAILIACWGGMGAACATAGILVGYKLHLVWTVMRVIGIRCHAF